MSSVDVCGCIETVASQVDRERVVAAATACRLSLEARPFRLTRPLGVTVHKCAAHGVQTGCQASGSSSPTWLDRYGRLE
jgi:hypothetical protein